MADTDLPVGSQEDEPSTGPHTAGDTAQPGDQIGEQISPSADEVVPLFDIIETCLEELPALRKFMPPRKAKAYLMSDGGLKKYSLSPKWSADLLRELDEIPRSDHAVLIIQDIDAYWFQALATRYPASLDVRFLAQHVLRLGGLSDTYDYHKTLYGDYHWLVEKVDAEISQRQSGTTVYRDLHCRHIDGQISRTTMEAESGRFYVPTLRTIGYRTEQLNELRDSQMVYKTDTRLSYSRIQENLTLVLVNAGPDRPGTLLRIRLLELLPADVSMPAVPMTFVINLFKHYTIESVFASPMAGLVDYFAHMLSTAAYQALVSNLEMELLARRGRATQIDSEQAFSTLTDLRRDLTNVHQRMARTSSVVADDLLHFEAHGHQTQKSPAQHMSEDTTPGLEGAVPKPLSMRGLRKSKPADLSKLSATFSELDARLRTLIAALNDDIQIVIGSVQIEDAKAMKLQAELTVKLTQTTMRQTEVSARQTRWTVALAILAALYLPMTLVTGIYGMNIKEISGDKGPNWWWVVVTWAVTMVITVGSVGRYALVELRWYRQWEQGPNVAVNQNPTEDIPGEAARDTVKSTSNEADDTGGSKITRRKHLWRKSSQKLQHDDGRSTV